MKRHTGLLILLASVAAGLFSCANSEEYADLVIRNGEVLTVDSGFTQAEAVAIRDGVFMAVGSNNDMAPLINKRTRIIDAEGKAVIPGLIESHVHATSAARNEVFQTFTQLDTIRELQQWLERAVDQASDDEWIRLPRVEVTRIQERRFPTREELDEAAPHHPAVFVWGYADLQVQVLNSAAIEAAGLTKDTPAPEGGRIHLDEQGELTGVLENSRALTARYMPSREVTEEEFLDSLEQLLGRYNKMGITSIQERGSDVAGYRTFTRLNEEGRLPVRATVTIRLRSGKMAEEAIAMIESLPVNFRDGNDRVRVGPLKLIIDGGLMYGTAYLREPYGEKAQSFYGFEDPDHSGSLFMSHDVLTDILRAGHDMGWQMSSHVTGDAGVDLVLDALEEVNKDTPITDRRYTLIHAYFANEEAAKRAVELGVVVDTQPAWYYKDADVLAEVLGEDRINAFIGLQEWQRNGVHVVINSDHMLGFKPDTSLNPYNPFLAMYVAVTRQTYDGQVFGAEQKVSRKDALRMMTRDAAWMTYDEDRKGSIEVGKLADLAILTENPLTCEEDRLPHIRSVVTIVDGDIVYTSHKEE